MYIKSSNTFGKRGLLLLVYHTLCEIMELAGHLFRRKCVYL